MQSLIATQLAKTAISNAPALFALNRILGSNMPALSIAMNHFCNKVFSSKFHKNLPHSNINTKSTSHGNAKSDKQNISSVSDINNISLNIPDNTERRNKSITYYLNLYKKHTEYTSTFHPGSEGFIPGIPTKMHNHFKESIKSLTPEERTQLQTYTLDGHRSLNSSLRNNNALKIESHRPIVEMANKLHSALQKAHIPEDIIVYRKTRAPLWGLQIDQLNDIAGKVFTEKGFMSTTVNRNIKIADANILLKIDVPKGAKGAYIADLSWYSGEDEILFNKDQKLHVTSTGITREFSVINCKLLLDDKDLTNS